MNTRFDAAPGMPEAVPATGRLLARQLPGGEEVLLGVLQFGAAFVPREGALYLMVVASSGAHVVPTEFDADLPLELQGGVTGTLRAPVWRACRLPGALTVRFVEAFPESNGWTVYGPSQHSLFPQHFYHRGHAFVDVKAGALAPLTPPPDLNGMAPGQILDSLPIWPDAKGTLYAVPALEARWRETYCRLSELQASYGAGEITASELKARIKDDPRLSAIHCSRPDDEYCSYLAELRRAGGIVPARPLTMQGLADRETLAHDAVLRLEVNRRRRELQGLARELGIPIDADHAG